MLSWFSRSPGPCPACDARAEEVRWLRQRVDTLTDTLTHMKRDGFTPIAPPPEHAPRSMADPLPEAVELAVREMAPDDADLWSWARAQVGLGRDHEDVADEIYRGGDRPGVMMEV